MGDALEWLLGAASFVPHGYCLLWRPDLVALHALSDTATALAYFSIPAAILAFCHKRRDLDFPGLAILFATFILGCGLTHVTDLLTLWWPIYGAEGLAKAATATVSLLTAVVLNMKIRGRGFFRAVYFFPVLLSPVRSAEASERAAGAATAAMPAKSSSAPMGQIPYLMIHGK